ncbi:MAG: formate--phosphoribosylaminoimidazolecarboxamide ligase, partial [Candidatus Thermoplasmatota archaeon]
MVTRGEVASILADYRDLAVVTVCSHSSLQIFHGARQEGFRTIGIAIGKKPPKFYDAFPRAKPDEFFLVDSYEAILDRADELVAKHAVAVPHGSFVEYMGAKNFLKLRLPTFGNRKVLAWESDREKQREWLVSAGVDMPRRIKKPSDIDRPVFVKYHGAKGGKGAFIAKTEAEFRVAIKPGQKYTIQEYIVGTRYYIHYFFSPLVETGYRLSKGSLELLGVDRRDEANIDEMYKLGAQERLRELGLFPTFVVTGNMPVVLRESLLPTAFDMAERVVERSMDLFGGMIGPFCLETIVTDDLKFKVFEISTRIVAGTNLFIGGSPYSELTEPGMSTGRRIARE